jgi:hypothetical protein
MCWPAVMCNAIYENVYLLGKLIVHLNEAPC